MINKLKPIMDLFSNNKTPQGPLAHRMRPQNFEDFIGQEELIEQIIKPLLQSQFIPSLILWGPPGTGKTTLAKIIAQKSHQSFESLSAVTSGIKDVKEVIDRAKSHYAYKQKPTLLFLDEIHRFNKAQQDFLLPHVESGLITLIGATTENPSFEINNALLSRSKVLVLKSLSSENLKTIVLRALTHPDGLKNFDLTITPSALDQLVDISCGDARYLLGLLESAAHIASSNQKKIIDPEVLAAAGQKKALPYDAKGEEHYNTVSAFIKSMRGSDPDAAIYYLARMLDSGEEPLFIARRLVIFASEDVGNADPKAIQVAINCMQALDFVGMPEGWIPLAQATTYLASTFKSNASYTAYKEALSDIREFGPLEVPTHLRNAPTKLMKNLGYGKNYDYAHNNADHLTEQKHLPDKLQGKTYYKPDGIGYEKHLLDWLEKAKQKRNQ